MKEFNTQNTSKNVESSKANVAQCLEKFDINKLIMCYVKPALGCTEPCAIGLATSCAFNVVNGKIPSFINSERVLNPLNPANKNTIDDIKHIELTLDNNVLKNALYVCIPGTDQKHGVDLAAALGLFSDPDKELTLFETIKESPENLIAILNSKKIKEKIEIKQDKHFGLFIKAKIIFNDQTISEAIIKGSHANVTNLSVNKEQILKETKYTSTNDHNLIELKDMTIEEMIKTVEENLSPEAKKLIWDGIIMNIKVARMGIKEKFGDGLGYLHAQLGDLNGSVEDKIITYLTAATDVRMAGAEVPVMSSLGSGNQGLVITISLTVLAEHLFGKSIEVFDDKEKDELIKTVALAHQVTAYSTFYTGMLSPLCGSTSKGGLGVSAAMAYLLYNVNNKTLKKPDRATIILYSMKNMMASTCGILCDGAKGSCSTKSRSSAYNAYASAREALYYIVATGGIPGHKEMDIKTIMENFVETFIEKLGQPTDRHIVNYLLTTNC